MDADAHTSAAEPAPHFERLPAGRKDGVDRKRVAHRSQAREAERERAPDAAHCREVQPAGGHVSDIVEVDAGDQAQHLDGLGEAACACEQRCVHAGGERASVRAGPAVAEGVEGRETTELVTVVGLSGKERPILDGMSAVRTPFAAARFGAA